MTDSDDVATEAKLSSASVATVGCPVSVGGGSPLVAAATSSGSVRAGDSKRKRPRKNSVPDINSRERLVLSINSDYYGTSISNRVLMKDMKGGRWKWNQVEMEIAVESAVMSSRYFHQYTYLFPPF